MNDQADVIQPDAEQKPITVDAKGAKQTKKSETLITTRGPYDNGVAKKSKPMDMDAIFDEVDRQDEDDLHDEGEDDFVDPKSHSTFILTLQSADAQGAWHGKPPTRQNNGFPGVEWFARKCGRVCRAVREDDPYAMMALHEIEIHLRTMRSNFKIFLDESEALLGSGSDDGMTYIGPSKYQYTPKQYDVEPRNGYAFAAIQLVGRFDRVVMYSHQARDMSLISSYRFSEMKNRKPFRTLTWALARFKKSGATREDFRLGTIRAKEAVEKYGMVTEEVMADNFELLLMEVKGPAPAKTPPFGRNNT